MIQTDPMVMMRSKMPIKRMMRWAYSSINFLNAFLYNKITFHFQLFISQRLISIINTYISFIMVSLIYLCLLGDMANCFLKIYSKFIVLTLPLNMCDNILNATLSHSLLFFTFKCVLSLYQGGFRAHCNQRVISVW